MKKIFAYAIAMSLASTAMAFQVKNQPGTSLDASLFTYAQASLTTINPSDDAYTAGDVVGKAQAVVLSVTRTGGMGAIVDAWVIDGESLQATLDAQVMFFKEFPGTPPDNSPLVLTATATATIIGVVSLDPDDSGVLSHSLGAIGMARNGMGENGPMEFVAATGVAQIWALVIAGDAVDYTGAAKTLDFTFVFARQKK